jgi:hypothetical protein
MSEVPGEATEGYVPLGALGDPDSGFVLRLMLDDTLEEILRLEDAGSDAAFALRLYQGELEDALYLVQAAGAELLDNLPAGVVAAEEPEVSTCSCCLEENGELVTLKCGHMYCGHCLGSLVDKSMADEARFPPRCCKQAIDVYSVADVLGRDRVEQFERKKVEYSTKDRTYCSRLTCSAFVATSGRATDTVKCGRCGRVTCRTCKKVEHGGDCVQDEGVRQVLEVAGREQWQRCRECREMVERLDGCNHIEYSRRSSLVVAVC